MIAETKSYIYIICDPEKELYKIGVTKNLYSKRLKQLQTGNPTQLHIITYYLTQFPYKMEKQLHIYFNNKKEYGEWFKLNPQDIIDFQNICNEIQENLTVLNNYNTLINKK